MRLHANVTPGHFGLLLPTQCHVWADCHIAFTTLNATTTTTPAAAAAAAAATTTTTTTTTSNYYY